MSERLDEQRTAEWRYLRAAWALVAVLVVVELAGWAVYRSVHHGQTALELTERCLRREKLLPIESLTGDAIARTASGGTLATRVQGNGVQVVIARSGDEAARLAAAYLRTGRKIDLRLDVRDRVLYVWELPQAPSPTQRQTMYDCWYE
ncbi:MAG TPA: hypothetical protein VHR46_08635 [Gaiella sp.]|nr:hypothetical protein [Gaiella sp.]